MTEREWLEGKDPRPMLEYLRGKARVRQLRLFACACCRHVWDQIQNELSRDAVETTERLADGLAELYDLQVIRNSWAAAPSFNSGGHWIGGSRDKITQHLTGMTDRPWEMAGNVAWETAHLGLRRKERQFQATGLRCIFGNPFCPFALDPSWLTPTVLALAQATYEERELPSGHLDAARLAILADALEDAGCTEAEILNHLRGPGPHLSGCWPLDLLLSRG